MFMCGAWRGIYRDCKFIPMAGERVGRPLDSWRDAGATVG